MLSLLFTTLLDASVVNGGAIDAFIHALRIEHILGLLLAGIVCAQFTNRQALLLVALATAGLLLGAFMTAAGVALPFAAVGWVAALAALAVCAVLAKSAPAWLAGIAVMIFTLLVVNSHAIELQSRGMGYELSFLLTFVICAIGLVWIGLALAFIAGRSRAGVFAMRAAGVVVAVIGVFTLMGKV